MTTRLILVSHALTDWNLEGLIQGHTDVPLNWLGHRMARQLAMYLSDKPIHAIYSSDLKRAYQTACPTARSKSMDMIIDMGLREGRIFRQVRSPVHPTLAFPDEIETYAMALSRFSETLTRISETHPGQTVLVVTHAGVLKVFVNSIVIKDGMPPFNGVRMALNVIDYDAGSWQGITLNQDVFLNP